MTHLSSSEFVDYVEGTLPSGRGAHVQTCVACRAQAETLRETLARASRIDAPDPSPLFWDHFSNRVRDAIAPERPAAPWVGLRALRPIPLALAAAVATFATFLALHRLPAPVVPPAAANIVSSSPGVAAVPPSPGPGSESDLANDEAWNLISAVASGVELEEAHAAGFGVRPGEIDRAVGEMTPVERTVLGRLLRQELKRAGA